MSWKYLKQWKNGECFISVNGVEVRLLEMSSFWHNRTFIRAPKENIEAKKMGTVIRKLKKIYKENNNV